MATKSTLVTPKPPKPCFELGLLIQEEEEIIDIALFRLMSCFPAEYGFIQGMNAMRILTHDALVPYPRASLTEFSEAGN